METLGFYKADFTLTGLSNIQGTLQDAIAAVFWRGKMVSSTSVTTAHEGLAAQRELDTNVEPNDFIVYSASYSVKVSVMKGLFLPGFLISVSFSD